MDSISPALVVIVLLATICAALAHSILGRRWIQLPIFWLAASVGCLIVYGAPLRLPLALAEPAGVPLLEATLTSWVLILVASRLRIR